MTAPAADPDRPCLHPVFESTVVVNRIQPDPESPPVAYVADVRVSCESCGEPFRWNGAPAGMSFTRPMVSIDETELRAPLRPASADPDFGIGLPGFAVQVVDGT